MSEFRVVRIDASSYALLREAAQTMNQSIAELVRQSVRGALPEIVRRWQMQKRRSIDDAAERLAQSIVTHPRTRALSKSDGEPEGKRKRPMIAETPAVFHPPEMSRVREPNQRLVWLFHAAFSKLTSPLRQGGWTEATIRTFGRSIWKACQDHGCISFGGDGESAWEESNLVSYSPSDARQLRFLPNMIAGDVIVATLGNRMLGWGYVKAKGGKAYHWLPNSLKSLRARIEDKFERRQDWWFNHVIWVDWKHQFGKSGIQVPSVFPLQPTVRAPRIDNTEAWRFLKKHGVPVDEHGQVLGQPIRGTKRKASNGEEE